MYTNLYVETCTKCGFKGNFRDFYTETDSDICLCVVCVNLLGEPEPVTKACLLFGE